MSQANIPNVPLYLNGEKVQSTSKEWRDVLNPATQEVVARVPFATKEEVDRAVANAKETFKTWRNTSLAQRMRIMLKFQQLLRENIAPLAELITRQIALDEVPSVISRPAAAGEVKMMFVP